MCAWIRACGSGTTFDGVLFSDSKFSSKYSYDKFGKSSNVTITSNSITSKIGNAISPTTYITDVWVNSANFSKFSTLKVTLSCTQYNGTYTYGLYANGSVASTTNTTMSQTVTFSMPLTTKSGDIGFRFEYGGNGTVTVSKVWLE